MNVSLTPELEKYVHDKVSSGGYASASEVVREALRQSRDRQRAELDYKHYVDEKIQRGLKDIEEGRVHRGTPEEFASQARADGMKKAAQEMDGAA